MKSDVELKSALMQSLEAMMGTHRWPVEVQVDHGMVTLIGQVDTHQTRFQIERAARRVGGMRGLQINIKPTQGAVRQSEWHRRPERGWSTIGS